MKNKMPLILVVIFAFFYRIYGLNTNQSFWSDESHVAIFVRTIIESKRPILESGYSTGVYQQLQYWLSALMVNVFGLNEFAIRFPSIIFGTLTIVVTYFLGKKFFNSKIGMLSAIITTFLTIEILWSRQARPYQAIQFFYLSGTYYIYSFSLKKGKKAKEFLFFITSGILATLFHLEGFAILLIGIVYLIAVNLKNIKKLILFSSLLLTVTTPFFTSIKSLLVNFRHFNHFNYYRIFLTHNYLPLLLLAIIGAMFLARKKNYNKLLCLLLFINIPILFASFFLTQPFIRYIYAIFPLIILLANYGLIELIKLVKSNQDHSIFKIGILTCAITIAIFGMKNKFVIIPQKTYSLNEDMQEIPEVDWKKTYALVDEKLESSPDAILITNWNDLPIWFLGEGSLDYLVRNDSRESDPVSSARIINSLDKFKKLVENESAGIIVLDSWDDWIPDGVRDYCQENLKKEFEIDRLYPTQPRYWPVNVYSWGLD